MSFEIDGLRQLTAIIQRKLDQHPDWTDAQIDEVVPAIASDPPHNLVTERPPYSDTSRKVRREDGTFTPLPDFLGEVRKSHQKKA